MNSDIRKQLKDLIEIAQSSKDSEVPEWLRERVIVNTLKLIESDAKDRLVAQKLAGGLRAILDVSSPSDDDPIVSRIVSLIEKIESGMK